jgi:hypothetical protein
VRRFDGKGYFWHVFLPDGFGEETLSDRRRPVDSGVVVVPRMGFVPKCMRHQRQAGTSGLSLKAKFFYPSAKAAVRRTHPFTPEALR